MASNCTITFENNPLCVYYAGQKVSGVAELSTTRPKTIKSIYISINGFAEVRWTENITKESQGKRVNALETFSASELYFTSEKCVYGQSGGSQLELPAGKYAYPFQATIPPNVPTSFNGSDGHIQYEVSVVIDRVLRYNNIFKKAFTVISPYDLNLNSANAIPMEQEEEKVFCFNLCCGATNPMIAKIRVPFSAYAPGQRIRFNALIDNQSDVDCSEIKVRLLRKATYTSRSPETKSKWNEVKIAQNLLGEVIKHNKAEMNEFLEIPSTVPSSLENCSLIKLAYTLKFTLKLPTLYTDLDVVFPLIIGTIPLQASIMEKNGIVAEQPAAEPVYKPLAPPTYEEDITAKEKFLDNPYVPRYPVFSSTNSSGTIRSLYPSTSPQTLPPHPVSAPTPFIENSPRIGWKA